MVQYFPGDAKSILKNDNSTDDDDDDQTPDPGAEIVEKNRRDRTQRLAASTKEELDKVLKRVDNVKIGRLSVFIRRIFFCFFFFV